jgi:hypothetical protein
MPSVLPISAQLTPRTRDGTSSSAHEFSHLMLVGLVDHERLSSRSSGSQVSAGEARNGASCDGVRLADLLSACSPGWLGAAIFLRLADAVARAIFGEVGPAFHRRVPATRGRISRGHAARTPFASASRCGCRILGRPCITPHSGPIRRATKNPAPGGPERGLVSAMSARR